MSEAIGNMGAQLSAGVAASVGRSSASAAEGVIPKAAEAGQNVSKPVMIDRRASSRLGEKNTVSAPEGRKVGVGSAEAKVNSGRSSTTNEFADTVVKVAKTEGVDAAFEVLATGETTASVSGENKAPQGAESQPGAPSLEKETEAKDSETNAVQTKDSEKGSGSKTQGQTAKEAEVPEDPREILDNFDPEKMTASEAVKRIFEHYSGGQEITHMNGVRLDYEDVMRLAWLLKMAEEEKNPEKRKSMMSILLEMIWQVVFGTVKEGVKDTLGDTGLAA